MLICGVDPGKTTGLFFLELAENDNQCMVMHAFQAATLDSVLQLLQDYRPDVLVVEDFILRSDKAVQVSGHPMYSSEVIGALRALDRIKSGECKLVFQLASAKNTVSKNLLVQAGFWYETRNMPHARDAARHVLHYCLRSDLGIPGRGVGVGVK